VHDVIEVDGRRGIVYARVDGPTLLDQLLRAERSPRDVGRTLAAVHLAMHAVAVPGLADLAAVIRVNAHLAPRAADVARTVSATTTW
jgi:hypothetical protein